MTVLPRVGFVGAGNMATALIKGLARARGGDGSNVAVTDLEQSLCSGLHEAHGVRICTDARALVAASDIVVLAVKPQAIEPLLGDITDALDQSHLVISVAAGVTTAQLAAHMPPGPRVVRAMPNTPALVGAGATAVCAGPRAGTRDLELAQALFESVGRVVTVPERLINAVTGLSGSGPAYIFLVIEALADAGVREGLSRTVAVELAAQTVAGAAALVLQTGDHPAALKDRVASPGGATIAGLAALEETGLRHALQRAVRAACARSAELSESR